MPADHRVLLAGIVLWCASTAIVRLPRVNEPVSVVGVRPAIADFDGDHRTDWTVRRPDTGIWYSILSGSGTAIARTWGLPTDVDVAADFDGDGTTDLAAWRVGPQGGEWSIVNSADGTVRFDVWEGDEGDVPMAGDVDGDGKADQVIFRPRSGEWWVKTSGGVVSHHFWGQSSDQPLLADVDGDGRDDFVIFRPYGDWWALLQGGGFRDWQLGLPDDIPVIGDFDGDGLADPTVFRPSSGQWWVLQSTTGTLRSAQWGLAGDVPMRGDVDGDGRSDFIVWRPDAGAFFAQYSSGGSAAVGWGVPGDQPVGRMWGTTGGGTITFSGLTIDAAPITRYVENGFTLARASGTWRQLRCLATRCPLFNSGRQPLVTFSFGRRPGSVPVRVA